MYERVSCNVHGIVCVCSMDFKRLEIMSKEFWRVRDLDPKGTALKRAHRLRKRSYMNPGPNFARDVDGYDKLKPYGFTIHGCVDGFSRRVMCWGGLACT